VAQFDIHRNPAGRNARSRPFVLDIQSNRYGYHPFRLVVVLASRSTLPESDIAQSHLTPLFEVDGLRVFLNPFEITPVPLERLGPAIARLDDEEDQRRVQKALDDVLAHG
jgi:toxin CcdB